MNKITLLSIVLILGCSSCKTKKAAIVDRLTIVKNYYNALNTSNDTVLPGLLTDSLMTKESAYNYEQTFSLKEYIEWMKWDAVFDPTYKILQIEQEHEIVKAKISKIDTRIFFLHEEPIVSNQIIRFENNKITSVETTKYVVFDDATFVKNRDTFLNWIDKNHPELTGFIHDQTVSGGLKYLKAITLYKNKK